jgi:hypothetical protein
MFGLAAKVVSSCVLIFNRPSCSGGNGMSGDEKICPHGTAKKNLLIISLYFINMEIQPESLHLFKSVCGTDNQGENLQNGYQ